jgi:hypothetical protein
MPLFREQVQKANQIFIDRYIWIEADFQSGAETVGGAI